MFCLSTLVRYDNEAETLLFQTINLIKVVQFSFAEVPGRNRLARSAIHRKVGGLSPPVLGSFCCNMQTIIINNIFI